MNFCKYFSYNYIATGNVVNYNILVIRSKLISSELAAVEEVSKKTQFILADTAYF